MVKLSKLEWFAVLVGSIGAFFVLIIGGFLQYREDMIGTLALFLTAINTILITAIDREVEKCQTTRDTVNG